MRYQLARFYVDLRQIARIAWASCVSLAALSCGACWRIWARALSSFTPRMAPSLATKLAASSRAAWTTLLSRREEVASELASEVAFSAPTIESVVTIRLLALALAATANRAAALSRRRRDME